MSDYESVDYFTDMSLVPDPYPYFDHLRAKCPVQQATPYGVVAVTGHQEALAAYKDPAMSSCVAVAGPFPPLPFTPEGDDISAQIEEHRATIPMAEHVVTMDAEAHQKTRGLLSKLITPKRLSENEDFMWRLVDQRLDKIIGRGACEFTEDFAKPLAMLVIADLLGVPTEDHQEFKTIFGNEPLGEIEGAQGETVAHNPLLFLDEKFTAYISDRRREPRSDVLTELAAATYPCPMSTKSSSWRRSCSPQAPTRRRSWSARPCGCSANGPTSNRRFATTGTKSQRFSRSVYGWKAPSRVISDWRGPRRRSVMSKSPRARY